MRVAHRLNEAGVFIHDLGPLSGLPDGLGFARALLGGFLGVYPVVIGDDGFTFGAVAGDAGSFGLVKRMGAGLSLRGLLLGRAGGGFIYWIQGINCRWQSGLWHRTKAASVLDKNGPWRLRDHRRVAKKPTVVEPKIGGGG
jgi:hypothetical protein